MTYSRKWTPQEEHLLKILRPTHTYIEISNEFQKRADKNLPGFSGIRSVESIRKKCQRDNITVDDCTGYEDNNEYTNRWAAIDAIQDEYKKKCINKNRGVIDPNDIETKILSLSDIHFPLARTELLEQAILDHDDADAVVLNGDILEGYIFSTFEKSASIAALDEYNCAFDFVQMLSERFPAVYLVSGNHDVRPARALKSAGFGKDSTQVLGPDLLARIANGERLDASGLVVEKLDFDNVHYDPIDSWYLLLGKTIFIHPHGRGGSQPGHTVKRWDQKFKTWYSHEDYDSVVSGHTHQLYKGIINETLLIEQGCLASMLAYSWKPSNNYLSNGQNGYAVIYQDSDGNTCFNKSGFVYCGATTPPKKTVI